MARFSSFTEACGLSIDASPHPPGIYEALLRKAASGIAQARGSDYAKITLPRKYHSHDQIYIGRILLWTDINIKGRWIDLSREDELPARLKEAIQIPEQARPNYRAFDYLFHSERHQFWFESKNEIGEKLGPTIAKRVLSILLTESLGPDDPEVTVTIIPAEGTVARILGLPTLKNLYIRVAKPNTDASSPLARQRVLARLDAENARRMEILLTKAKGSRRLTPQPETEELALVAADTGFVRGEATDHNGHKFVMSTEKYPKKIRIPAEFGASFFERIFARLSR